MKISMPALVAILCVYILLFTGVGIVIAKKTHQARLTQKVEKQVGFDLPTMLTIPKIGMNKEIKPGVYDFKAKEWTITSNFPHFASVSVVPNTYQGTTVIYAHNTATLFKHIDMLERGDTVTIETKGGTHFTYQYQSSKNVKPEDVSVFTSTGSPKLILITCVGENNSMRKLVYLKLISAI